MKKSMKMNSVSPDIFSLLIAYTSYIYTYFITEWHSYRMMFNASPDIFSLLIVHTSYISMEIYNIHWLNSIKSCFNYANILKIPLVIG